MPRLTPSRMNGASLEFVPVGGMLCVKDGQRLGVGHTLGYAWHRHSLACYLGIIRPLGYAWHSLACYLGIRHPLGYVWHSELTVLTNVRIYLGCTQYTFWPALI